MTPAIKECAVNFFKNFLDEVKPYNDCMREFNNRPVNSKLKIVTGRLVDQIEQMLAKWRENPDKDKSHHKLPVFIMGFGKEYSSTGLEKGRSISQNNFVVRDKDGHYFNLRVDKHDQRVQIALFSQDEESAFRFSSQFKLYCSRTENRNQYAITTYNDIDYTFPMTLEDNNIFGVNQTIDSQDNLTILVFDLTFNCNTPYFLGEIDSAGNEIAPYLPVVKEVHLSDVNIKTRKAFYQSIINENGITNLLIED